jgi:hypothetical protein
MELQVCAVLFKCPQAPPKEPRKSLGKFISGRMSCHALFSLVDGEPFCQGCFCDEHPAG